MNNSLPISVIIPTLNAETSLANTLEGICGRVQEVIVVDGGSVDQTRGIAAQKSAVIISSRRGRGSQLQAGGTIANCPWLLFLHADTVLDDGWENVAAAFLRTTDTVSCAAFSYALDDPSPSARRIERLVNWRSRALGLPFGDQGLLISRDLYTAVGGFRPIPLMEDVDIVRRIGKSRLVTLSVRARTSADRYRRGGWWARPARNLACLSLYYLGVPPRLLERLYR